MPVPMPVTRFRGRYPAAATSVAVMRAEVRAVARECGFRDRELGDVCLGVSEAATNAMVHCSVGWHDAHVRLSVELTAAEMLVILVEDGNAPDRPAVRMAFPVPRAGLSHERESAVRGLEVALTEQDRLGERLDAAVGTSSEVGAYARLRVAGERVAARQAQVDRSEP